MPHLMFLNPWYSGQGPGGGNGPSSRKRTPGSDPSGVPTQHPEDQLDEEEEEAEEKERHLTEEQRERLSVLQGSLRQGWTVHVNQEGRFYYCNHVTQTSGWLPPSETWEQQQHTVVNGTSAPVAALNLPYGWELATDKEGRPYYVNHLNKTTTYEDPRKWYESNSTPANEESPPEPRTVTLDRDAELGFGFVAGSEKPVIVRFVTSGGPSVEQLMPGDQILQINGEDVKAAPRDHVINLVRNCREKVTMLVCQPPIDNSSTRKSALLSAAKKARLKSNPNRVRFAESVDINGSPLHHNNPSAMHSQLTSADSVMPLMPNVLKVFLENGQTKSFKYDSSTTVRDVIDSLQLKLGLKSTIYFALVVEHIKSLRRNKLTILDPKDRLSEIASRPGAHNLRCLFRVTFVPADSHALLLEDPLSFEYLYVQCCNDVVQERFAPELKYDVALKLAALQMVHHLAATNPGTKVTVKAVEKECGLDRFVPASLAESMKRKELRKLLTHFLKLMSSSSSASSSADPGSSKQLTALQAKLHYLKIISELPSYGAKCFSTNVCDSNVETVILISPKFGISQINSLRNSVPLVRDKLVGLEINLFSSTRTFNRVKVTRVVVTKEDDLSQKLDIRLKAEEEEESKEPISLSLEDRDADELLLVLSGYYRLLTDRGLEILHEKTQYTQQQAPPFCSRHLVTPQGWNYPSDIMLQEQQQQQQQEFFVDLGGHPPYHPPPEGFRIPSTTTPAAINGINNPGAPFSSDSGSDADSSMTSSTTLEMAQNMDGNRNITNESNANNLSHTSSPRPFSTFATNNNNNNKNGGQKFPTNGILKKVQPPRAPPNSATSTPRRMAGSAAMDHMEARNDAVIRRVAEMKQLVADAEQYLHNDGSSLISGGSTGSTVSTGSTGSSSGHGTDSDSIVSGGNRSEMSEDASSSCGGGGGGKIKHSDSLIALQDTEEESRFLTEAVNRSLAAGGDVDDGSDTENGDNDNSGQNARNATVAAGLLLRPLKQQLQGRLKQSDSSFGLHSPDTFPQEAEDLSKKAKSAKSSSNFTLDSDLIDLTMIPPPMTPDEDGVYRAFPGSTMGAVSTPPTPFADRQTLEAELKAMDATDFKRTWKNNSENTDEYTSSSFAAVYHLRDLDSFIADTVVPPPPSSGGLKSVKAFIIPPPPMVKDQVKDKKMPNGNTGNFGSIGSDVSSKNNKESKVSPFIASLQQKLMSPERETPQPLVSKEDEEERFKNMHDTLARKKMIPPPLHSNSSSPVRSILKRQSSNPEDPSAAPPPPPPRSVVSRSSLLLLSGNNNNNNNNKQIPSYQFGSGSSPANFKLPLKSIASSSTETKKSSPVSPNKRSLTSSSDSLSSSASLNTVKSVSPQHEHNAVEAEEQDKEEEEEDGPPSLPPRLSPIKSAPPKLNIDTSKTSPNSSSNSPSSKPPVLPSRINKPVNDGISNGSRSMPGGNNRVPPETIRPPSQKTVVKIKENGLTYPSSIIQEDKKQPPPTLPQKSTARKLPLPPPKPKNGYESSNGKQQNGYHVAAEEVYSNSEYNDDDSSFEGTSVDDEEEERIGRRVLAFRTAEEAVAKVVAQIDQSLAVFSAPGAAAASEGNKEEYARVRERLTNESRHFVTASKLFVKSATESETQLLECLEHCVQMMARIAKVTRELALVAPGAPAPGSPQGSPQGSQLVLLVKDVAEAYLSTVQAAGEAAGRGMNDPSMGVLMKRATALAGVLTTLMRSLRVFN